MYKGMKYWAPLYLQSYNSLWYNTHNLTWTKHHCSMFLFSPKWSWFPFLWNVLTLVFLMLLHCRGWVGVHETSSIQEHCPTAEHLPVFRDRSVWCFAGGCLRDIHSRYKKNNVITRSTGRCSIGEQHTNKKHWITLVMYKKKDSKTHYMTCY